MIYQPFLSLIFAPLRIYASFNLHFLLDDHQEVEISWITSSAYSVLPSWHWLSEGLLKVSLTHRALQCWDNSSWILYWTMVEVKKLSTCFLDTRHLRQCGRHQYRHCLCRIYKLLFGYAVYITWCWLIAYLSNTIAFSSWNQRTCLV